MPDPIIHTRYAKEDVGGHYMLIIERHKFIPSTVAGSFTLPSDLFPQAQGTYVSVYCGNHLYDTMPAGYPLDEPLRPTVQLLTEAEFQVELELQQQAVSGALDANRPTDVAQPCAKYPDYSDAEKIFLIDFSGGGVKNNANKRQHFNLLYGFDPVDDDPRNVQ